MKEWLVTFTVSRQYDGDGLTKSDVKEMALSDFYVKRGKK